MSRNTRWLTARVWLDADGVHVWFRHMCAQSRMLDTMLPHPTWRADEAGVVTPSIVCNACGCHAVFTLGPDPGDRL